MNRIVFILLIFFSLGLAGSTWADPPRFFLMGDGLLVISGQSISYRNAQNQYMEAGLKKINRLFRAPLSPPEETLSLRFIEVLDYVQDQLQGGSYRLRSGYRSPRGNQALRTKGKLAAQSSMHVEAAAGDLFLSGVPSSKVFGFVKSLECCGIGWYHSRHFHLDTGPPRYWDEKTSKTEDKRPQQNEKIILQADWDRYKPGELVPLKFMRITEYPIGVPGKFTLVQLGGEAPQEKEILAVKLSPDVPKEQTCRTLQNRSQARALSVTLPKKDLPPGKYTLKVSFCNRYAYEKMPETILSRPFEVVQ